MKIIKHKLNIIVICLLVFTVSSFASETNIVSDCAIPWRFNSIAQKTDTLVIGSAASMKGTFLNPYHHIDFYVIHVNERITGKRSNIVMAVYQNITSSFGRMVQVQPDKEYMFFLEKCDESFDELPKDMEVYTLVRFWQGIISLDSKATESRSVRKIKDQYDIDIYKYKDSFINAVKATVVKKSSEIIADGDEEQLSTDANKIFNTLGLKKGIFTREP